MWSYNYYGLDSSDSLSHYGVLGMKWGRRKARVSSGSGSGKSRKKSLSSKQLKSMQTINKSVKTAIDAGKELSSRKKSKNSIDLSNMTDKELQQRVNRLNLERQYRSLMPEEVSRGRKFVDDTLSIAGSVATVAGSALSIALAIKQLKGD